MATLHQLYLFVKVAEMQNFSAVANQLYISQPSISAQIKTLEKSLGLKLIDRYESRLKKKVVLTEAGEYIFGVSKNILREWDKVAAYAERKKDIITFKIMTNAPIGTYVLPNLIAEFKEKNRMFKAEIVIESYIESFIEKLKNGYYDIAIIPKDTNVVPLDFLNIINSFQSQIVLVNSKKCFCTKHVIPFKSLHNLPIALPPKGTLVGKILDFFLNKHSIFLNNTIELDHSESVKRILLKHSDYYGLLSFFTVKEEIESGALTMIRTNPPLPVMEYAIVHHNKKTLKSNSYQFIEFLITKLQGYFQNNRSSSSN